MSSIAKAIEEDLVAWRKQDSGIWTELDNVGFWSPGMDTPRSTSSCEWNLGLDKQRGDTGNWECPFCDSLQPLTRYTCANCGAARIREY